MVADHAQYSRPAGGHVRAFRYVPLVLCTAVASSLLTWSVAMRTASAADMVRLGGALLSGAANCTNTSSSVAATAAAGGSAREEDHRKAVIDRLYGGDDAADHLGSMRLLDPEVGPLAPSARLGCARPSRLRRRWWQHLLARCASHSTVSPLSSAAFGSCRALTMYIISCGHQTHARASLRLCLLRTNMPPCVPALLRIAGVAYSEVPDPCNAISPEP